MSTAKQFTFDVLLIPDGGGGFIAEIPGLLELGRVWGDNEENALVMAEQILILALKEEKGDGGALKQDYLLRTVTVTL